MTGIPITDFLESLTNIAIGVGGALTLVSVFLGIIQYCTSQGDPTKSRRAKNTITGSTIGLTVIVISWAVIELVLLKLIDAEWLISAEKATNIATILGVSLTVVVTGYTFYRWKHAERRRREDLHKQIHIIESEFFAKQKLLQ